MKEKVINYFTERFGFKPEVFAFAPGRLEILGNHTDYNEGFVLSTAVNLGTYFACRKVGGSTCSVSLDVKGLNDDREREFSLLNLNEKQPKDWANYIKGVIVELQKRGYSVPAFEAAIMSTVPLSAGMSSSASLEMAVCYAVGKLIERYTDSNVFDKISKAEWAKIGQGCENSYVGANTGLLDQFSSVMGKKDHLVFSDFRTLEVRNIPLPHNLAMVIANTFVTHDLTEEYGERRQSCEAAAAFFYGEDQAKTHLRDVSVVELEAAKGKLSETAYKRARHVVGEDERVIAGNALLKAGRIVEFGKLMNESHESSINFFENSCPELDALVAAGSSLDGHIGARLSGGGFGGISVHFVEKAKVEDYAMQLKMRYRERTGKEAETIICVSGDGAYVETV